MKNQFKTCCNCRRFQSVANFYINRTAKYESNRYQSRCKNCSKQVSGYAHKKKKRERERLARVLACEKLISGFKD
jgi:hypothetical protein